MNNIELYNTLKRAAERIYNKNEAMQIARMIMDERYGVSWHTIASDPQAECKAEDVEQVIREIESSRPVQYIIGEAEFCDFRLTVREGVLIPRPESEELIRWIVSEHTPERRILDIGCGSGALSIALNRALTPSQVVAVDISEEAVTIARANCDKLSPSVEIVLGDALMGVESIVEGEFDIILSNPPYIPQSEIEIMQDNVVCHEPHLALFVADDDPLIFYSAIGRSAQKLLRHGGKLYFEIHERFAEEVSQLLSELGYIDIRVRLDINDKARMICAQKE